MDILHRTTTDGDGVILHDRRRRLRRGAARVEQLTENAVDDALYVTLGDGDTVLLCRALNRVVAHDIRAEHVPADDGVNGVRDGITLDGDAVLADRRRARCTRNAAADGRVVHGDGIFLNDARSR